jgi:hypothetical protein
MEKSESIKNLVGALIKAQSEIKLVEKGATNPFFKSKYADLPAIDHEYKRVFPKHGLVVSQLIEGSTLVTILAHESGEYVLSAATLNPVKNDPQGLGSAITYMRRYALGAICGIVASEDDDDGNHSSHAEAKPQTYTKPVQETAPAPAKPSDSGLAPAAPEQKRVIGKITDSLEGSNGFVTYRIKGVELSTNKPEIMLVMDKAEKEEKEVQVVYREITKGKFTNRYIQSAEVAEALPF